MQLRRPLLGIGLFTVATLGEFAALYYWQRLVSFPIVLRLTVLWAGFLIERGAVVAWLRLPSELRDPWGKSRPLWLVLLVTTSAEIFAWTFWWPLSTQYGFLLGIVFFSLAIHAIHSYEVAIVSRTDFMSSVTQFGPIIISAIEATGGFIWLHLIDEGKPGLGALVLLASLLLEHILQVLSQIHVTQ
jgi:hypothetical protein